MNLLTAAVITAGAIGCTAADRTSASVTERGIGPLGVGMTVAQARGVLPGFSVPTDKGCEYARGAGLPAGVGVMVEDGIVVRFDVDSGTVPTAAGVRVGDPALRIRFVYGARVTSAPNKYTSEQDFTVRSSDARDTTHELIFETLKDTIVRYRAGKRPQVRYVERCG